MGNVADSINAHLALPESDGPGRQLRVEVLELVCCRERVPSSFGGAWVSGNRGEFCR
jgi:hypothetical protein